MTNPKPIYPSIFTPTIKAKPARNVFCWWQILLVMLPMLVERITLCFWYYDAWYIRFLLADLFIIFCGLVLVNVVTRIMR